MLSESVLYAAESCNRVRRAKHQARPVVCLQLRADDVSLPTFPAVARFVGKQASRKFIYRVNCKKTSNALNVLVERDVTAVIFQLVLIQE